MGGPIIELHYYEVQKGTKCIKPLQAYIVVFCTSGVDWVVISLLSLICVEFANRGVFEQCDFIMISLCTPCQFTGLQPFLGYFNGLGHGETPNALDLQHAPKHVVTFALNSHTEVEQTLPIRSLSLASALAKASFTWQRMADLKTVHPTSNYSMTAYLQDLQVFSMFVCLVGLLACSPLPFWSFARSCC